MSDNPWDWTERFSIIRPRNRRSAVIIQCEGCEGTSFEVHSDEGAFTFICKHCGEQPGKYAAPDPGERRIDVRGLAGAEDAAIGDG